VVTLKQVAKDAGVSMGTVSKVINGISVGKEYQAKVEESIKKLDYKVNIYARGLKAQRTNTVAVIVPNLINSFFALWVYNIEMELSKNNYKLYLCISNGNADKEAGYIEMAKQNKVDGIIGITYSDIENYVSDDLPFVSLDRHFKANIKCVASDNYQGGEIAAEKLISSGCKHLLYIRTGSNIEGETLKRKTGFEDVCIKGNIDFEICDMNEVPSIYTSFSARNKLSEYFKDNVKNGICKFDGIFASSDHLAVVIVEEIKLLGLKVPEDIQIIGFDGLRMLNAGNYLVSSIEQPIDLLAAKCVDIILKLISKEKVESISLLPVKFVEGGTTK
jgi:LacI family transcriptional regulator